MATRTRATAANAKPAPAGPASHRVPAITFAPGTSDPDEISDTAEVAVTSSSPTPGVMSFAPAIR